MPKYISILRGINVSGQKKIKMAELKLLYESLKFHSVTTYIQSGNVIFDSPSMDSPQLKVAIEKAIQDRYNFSVPVEIRSHQDFEEIINNNPFNKEEQVADGTKLLISFLSAVPADSKVDEIKEFVIAPEKLVVRGREVYLHCPNGYGKSKLSNNFLERKLGVAATTRNWKTVNKLHELSI